MSSKRDVYTVVSDVLKELPESELEGIKSCTYFCFKFPELEKEFEVDFQRFKLHEKIWKSFLREIRFWGEVGVEYMNKRLLQLSLRYISKEKNFFKIENEVGSFTLPSRIDRLNKISLLSKELIYDIFPRIESHINFKADIVSQESKTIKGKIDWNRTILNSINRGEKFPLQFTCITTETNFDTPENNLAIFCILKIQNDVDYLLMAKDVQNQEFNFKEINILKKLKQQIDNLVSHTNMKEIIPKLLEYKNLSVNSKFTHTLEDKTTERIRQGIITQKSYSDLVDWLSKYRGYNVRSLSNQLANFPIEHTKAIDFMYELWIIFEMVTYFVEKKDVKFVKALQKGETFEGFELELNGKKFNLNYQGEWVGWSGYKSEPDFTIQPAGTKSIPIVMDPKNWTGQPGEAVHKMQGYLMNLSKFDARVGILFFSRPLGLHGSNEESPEPYILKTDVINDKELTFITMLVNPNSLDTMETNFDIVYQQLDKVLN